MQRRTTDTRKPSQNQASATHLNPFQTRPFGTDIAKKPETPTTDIDFDAQYEHAKSHAHNLANVPIMPPSTPNIQTKSSIENSIETQTTTNPTHQHIQRQTPGISVAKSLNVPTFQELQNRPEVEQQNIQSRPLVTPHWAAKPSNSVSPVQAKLTIGQPGDKYEQEADQVASQVVQQINTPASTQTTQGQSVQRQEEPVEELQAKPEISSLQRMEEPEEELQAKPEISSLQRMEEPEEELQAKPEISSLQRMEEPEEELQAKPEISSLQRMEEPEEELQAKPEISSLQRMEEPEEELQAKPEISSLQRMEEPEEELQAKPEISSLQRMEEPEEELQAKSTVQRREAIGGGEASQDLDTAINSSRGSGQPLDASLQQSMGQAMGADFSGVKIHTDAQSDQLNRSIQARAFTTGQDVFFRQGAYEPGSRGGQELIAHELTHVVQQNGGAVQVGGRVKPTMQMKDGVPVNDDQSLERETDEMGARSAEVGEITRTSRLYLYRDMVGLEDPKRQPIGGMIDNGHDFGSKSLQRSYINQAVIQRQPKPKVTQNQQLKNYVNALFKSAPAGGVKIGDGSALAACSHEVNGNPKVGGADHIQKCNDILKGVSRLLDKDNNPQSPVALNDDDYDVACDLEDDLKDALAGKYTG